jgi:hypothetical protein
MLSVEKLVKVVTDAEEMALLFHPCESALVSTQRPSEVVQGETRGMMRGVGKARDRVKGHQGAT